MGKQEFEMIGKAINQNLSVSPQITIADIAAIKGAGFEQIICNRPDGESPDQTPFADIEAAAKEHHIEIIHQPIIAPTLNLENGSIFLEKIEGKRTFAYCRTGTRCITLWALGSVAKGGDRDEIEVKAASLGYDLTAPLDKFFG